MSALKVFCVMIIALILLGFGEGICQKTPSNLGPKPLVSYIYTADPSVHLSSGRIYPHPLDDAETNRLSADEGNHYEILLRLKVKGVFFTTTPHCQGSGVNVPIRRFN